MMNPRPLRRRLSTFLIVPCLGMAGHQVRAGVTDCTAPLPLTVNIQSVGVPTSLPLGQVIPGARGNFTVTETCVNNTPSGAASWYLTENSYTPFTLVPGYTDVYTISGMVAGIGFRLRAQSGNALQTIATSGGNNSFVLAPATTGTNTLSGSFELVRTATTVGSGAGSINTFMHVLNQVWGNQNSASSRINLNYTILPTTVAACSVTQSSMVVTLPKVSTSSLPSMGATSGRTAFGIGLNCEANAKPRISMTDATTPANTSDTLSPTPASTARGVGVQLQYGGQPIRYGPTPFSYTESATASINTVSLGTQSGTVQIPFTASYVRNGTTLQAGSVQAIATFMLSYQ